MQTLHVQLPNIEGLKAHVLVKDGQAVVTYADAPAATPVAHKPTHAEQTPTPVAGDWPQDKSMPRLVDMGKNVGLALKLGVAAFVASTARGGSVGHVYLPHGVNVQRFHRARGKFLCVTLHDQRMPRVLVGAPHITCKACVTALKSIERDAERKRIRR